MDPALAPLISAISGATGGERLRLIQAVLEGPSGEECRRGIGAWVTRLVPVDFLVPPAAERWRPLVQDAIQFLFSRLSAPRLAQKLVEQFELGFTAPPERRLIKLISRMPGLQKLGQVLARNRRLDPSLRTALIELENGMSDVGIAEIHAIIVDRLGPRLEQFAVKIDSAILSEASVSAVVRFTWNNPNRERERAVFKVLKSYVPGCFAEDMSLLQQLGDFLTSREQGYDFAVRDIDEMLTDVRLLLERELDFTREQATLVDAELSFRASIGIRVPHVISALSVPEITAMSEETGIKVTSAAPRSPIRRGRIAEQLIEALIAVPLFSRQDQSVFHADPHAGNLLYHEANRELVVLDWALAEHLSRQSRRALVMLAVMMTLRSPDGVRDAIRALRRPGKGRIRSGEQIIDRAVNRFFQNLSPDGSPGILDGMRLVDEIAMQGVHFDASLFLFRKSLFTLDGVLNDIAGPDIRMDVIIARQFLTRWAASFGLMYSPLGIRDVLAVEWNALLLPARRLLGLTAS
jgi:ubiquinone biosynthesis protein